MCVTRQRDYDATPNTIGAAREFVSAFAVAMLNPRGWTVADDAALLVSELVTSAVEAGCSQVHVTAGLHVDRMELVIKGRGAGEAAEPLAGLRRTVVQQLAARAELVRTLDGTLVGTVEVPCRPAWTATVPCDERASPG